MVWDGIVVHVKYWPDVLVWTCLPKRNNCCTGSIWTEPLDLLFLPVSVAVWHKNLLNRNHEENLCRWEFFYLLICWENPKSLLSSLSLSDTRLQKCRKGKDVTVVLQPRSTLSCWVTHGASCCCWGEGWPCGAEGIFGGREKLPTTVQGQNTWGRARRIFLRGVGEWLKRLTYVQAFCFWTGTCESWGEHAAVRGSGRSSGRVVFNSAFWDNLVWSQAESPHPLAAEARWLVNCRSDHNLQLLSFRGKTSSNSAGGFCWPKYMTNFMQGWTCFLNTQF